MTNEEKKRLEQYGTAYPCCGNCANIREAGYKLMCRNTYDYRDYDSIKCVYYEYKQQIQELEELRH